MCLTYNIVQCVSIAIVLAVLSQQNHAIAQSKVEHEPTFATVYSFEVGNPSACPDDLILASDGKLCGATEWGGDLTLNGGKGFGAIFEATSPSVLTAIYSFDGSDGAVPNGVIQGTDGSFYGTTCQGGDDLTANSGKGNGTMFKITPSGSKMIIYSGTFPGGLLGACPLAKLIQATDGCFYGTTSEGGAADKGTVFKIPTWGTLIILHSFNGDDGANPSTPLYQASDGNFYGCTGNGGLFNAGVVFELTSTGVFNLLHSFSYNDGANPSASLIQDSDGIFFGTTEVGGQQNGGGDGTVFRMTWTGTLTTLHAFTGGTDGGNPTGTLCCGRDGNYYGTTMRGGLSNTGTVFRISPSGNLTTLHNFARNEGGPQGVMVQDKDGAFIGITDGGGDSGKGSVFKITAP